MKIIIRHDLDCVGNLNNEYKYINNDLEVAHPHGGSSST